MITPRTRLTVQESPLSLSTTTEEDEEEEHLTTDDSVLELRNALDIRDTNLNNLRKSSLQSHINAAKGERSVVRTLFPARPPVNTNIPLSSEVNPVAHPLQVCSSSPALPGAGNDMAVRLEQQASCSQVIFGTPVCAAPPSPPLCMTSETSSIDNGGEKMGNVNLVEKTPKIPHNGYLLVHSTPLGTVQCQNIKHTQSVYDVPPHKSDRLASPKATPISTAGVEAVYQDLNCLSATPSIALVSTPVVAEETPCRNTDISSRPGNFRLMGGCDDVLDVLFMSSSELESHFNLQDSRQQTAGTVSCTSTDVRPSDRNHSNFSTCEDQFPEVTPEKGERNSIDNLLHKQTNHFSYPSSNKLICGRSHIKTGAVVVEKVVGSSLLNNSKKRVVDEGYRSGMMHVLGKPAPKKQCVTMDTTINATVEGQMDEVCVQANSGEEHCASMGIGCHEGRESGKECSSEGKSVQKETKEQEDIEDSGGGQSRVAMFDQELRIVKETDVQIPYDVNRVSGSSIMKCQSGIDDCEIVIECSNREINNHVILDNCPSISEPVPVEDVEPDQEVAQQVDVIPTLGEGVSGMDKENVCMLDTITLSPIPIIQMRHVGFPGLRRSAQKKSTVTTSVRSVTSSNQVAEKSLLASTPISVGSCKAKGVLGVAASSFAPVWTANEEKKAVDTKFEETLIFGSEAYKTPYISNPDVGAKTASTMEQSASLDIIPAPKYQSSNSILSSSCLTSLSCHSSDSASNSHQKSRPTKPRTKGFRAPRMASDVSEEEERLSLSKILRGYGVSSSSLNRAGSRISSCSGKKLEVSGNAILNDQGLLSEDSKNQKVCHIESQMGFAEQTTLEPSACATTGFTTAGGKGISVSFNSLKKAQGLVSDEIHTLSGPELPVEFEPENKETSEPSACAATTGFKTAGGKGISVSFNSLKKGQGLVFDEIHKLSGPELPVEFESENRETSEPSACAATTGFKTAGGKGISVSFNSLKKAQGLVSDEIHTLSGPELPVEFEPENKETSEPSACAATGFKTAGGKGISVSFNYLKKAQGLVSDEIHKLSGPELPVEFESENRETSEPSACAATTGFKTAGGKGISVSFNSLKKAQGLVSDEIHKMIKELPVEFEPAGLETSDPSSHTSTGFKTAGVKGKKAQAMVFEKSQTALEFESHMNLGSMEMIESRISAATVTGLETDGDASELLLKPRIAETADEARTGGNVASSERQSQHCSSYIPINTVGMNMCTSVAIVASQVEPTSTSPMSGDEDSSNYFSTQVVRQLLNFSSEEESSAEYSVLNNNCQSNEKVGGIDRIDCKTDKKGTAALDLIGCFDSDLPATSLSQQRQCETECYNLSESVVGHMETSSISSLYPLEDSICPSVLPSLMATCESFNASVPTQPGVSRSSEGKKVAAGGCSPDPTHPRDCIPFTGSKSFCECFDGEESLLKPCDSVSFPTGLTTAGGRKVNISSAALQTVKSRNNSSPPHKASPQRSSEGASALAMDVSSSATYLGLETASGKKVEISKEAVKEAKATLGCITGIDSQQDREVISDLPTTAGMNQIRKDSLSAGRAVVGESNQSWNSRSFHTASGKKVEMSEKSIREAKMFLGEPSGLRFDPINNSQAVSGKMSKDSEEPIQAAETVLGESYNKDVSYFGGFMTAGGKQVESEESITAAKSALGEPHNETTTSFCGFQTAGGRQVKISEESIREVRASSSLIPDTQQRSNQFPGLQTASGKHVDISKRSLQNARTTLNDRQSTKPQAIVSKDVSDVTAVTPCSAYGEMMTQQSRRGLTSIPEGMYVLHCIFQ